jgi:hypothetical protein
MKSYTQIKNITWAAVIGFGLLGYPGGRPAHALTTLTFDETGACSYSTGTACQGVLGTGPFTGGVEINNAADVFGQLFNTGFVNILDASNSISDQLVFTNAQGNVAGGTLGNLIYFFSYDADGLMADVSFAPLTVGNSATIHENPDGTFVYQNAFFGTSGVAVPGPIAGAGLPGLLVAGAAFLAWKRRKTRR